MLPAERKKQKEDRAKLRGYRNRLMLLKDLVPNINELLQDNAKIIQFFESDKATKYEAKLNSSNESRGKSAEVKKKAKN